MIHSRKTLATWVAVLIVGGGLTSPVIGQMTEGGTAFDNLQTVGARAPGNMVTAGVARALETVVFPFGGVTITESSRPQSPKATFFVDAINAIFDQVDTLVLFFDNLLRARAGLPLTLPNIPSAGTGGSVNSGDTGGTGGGTGGSVNTGDGRGGGGRGGDGRGGDGRGGR